LEGLTSKSNDILKVIDLHHKKPQWDPLEAKKYCQVPETKLFDAFSLRTVVKRFQLLCPIEDSPRKDTFVSPDDTRLKLASLLRQNLCITSNAIDVLNCSLKFRSITNRKKMKEYINSEVGHWQFVDKALKNVVTVEIANSIEVWPEVILFIDVLRLAASKSGAAIAYLIELCEPPIKEKIHPWVPLLNDIGCDIAAKMVQAHRDINLKFEHANVGHELLASQASLDCKALLNERKATGLTSGLLWLGLQIQYA
jgi:hypothetical protein